MCRRTLAFEPTERVETAEPSVRRPAPGDVYSLESLYFSEHLYRGLLMVDAELNVVPAMADNMRVSSDGREYLFRLREGRALERRRAAQG